METHLSLKEEIDLLPAELWQEFMQYGRTALYPAGEWLPNASDGFVGMRLIEDGEVVAYAVQYAGKVELSRIGRGEFIGVRSMLSPESLPAIAWQAQGDVTCIEFEQRDVMQLFQDKEGFELRRVMERAARERDYSVLMLLHPLFRSLPRDERKHLLAGAHPVGLLPGERLLRQDIENDTLYLISRGRVKVLHDDQLVAHREAGEIVGEISVLEPDGVATADVDAVDWCEMLAFPGQLVREYSAKYSDFNEKLTQTL